MKRVLLLLGVFVALSASLASPAMAADAAPAATERLKALDQQILAALNRTRAERGLRPLVMSVELQEAAVAHSRAMLEKGFFAHDSPGGASFVARLRGFYGSAGYDSWTVAENLIYNTQEITADIAMAAWMASPGHRENILAPEWREVGIGSLHASSAGGPFAGEPTWVITMDFGARSGKAVKQKAAPGKATQKAPSGSKPKRVAKSVSKKAKPDPSAKKKDATAAKKQQPRAKPIDRVLPQPRREPEGESEDPAAVPDEDDDELEEPGDENDDSGGVDDSESDASGSDLPPLEPLEP